MELKYAPGCDLVSKTVLRDPRVVNMIVTTFAGEEAFSLYSPKRNEWSNDIKSSVIYAPSEPSADLPPILIEVQHTITADFIGRLLSYAMSTKKKYNVNPIVVVFGIHATCDDISADFETTSLSFIKQIPCKYWAEKCYILDKNTIADTTEKVHLPPIMAIAYFFSCQKTSLALTEYPDDPTLQELYLIAKEQTVTGGPSEKSATEALLEISNQTNLQFHKILNALEPMPDSFVKKRLRAYADDGAVYTQAFKRMYTKVSDELAEPMPPPPELSECSRNLIDQTSSTIEENAVPDTDMQYVHQFKQSVKKMDWKLCFETGKGEGYFKNLNYSSSLKTAFYKSLGKKN